MNSLDIERLYLLYKSGQTSEPDNKRSAAERKFTGDILQIAKATSPDLSLEDFAFIVMQLDTLKVMRDGDDNPDRKRITSREYLEKIWELPAYMQSRNAPFKPARDRQNKPKESPFRSITPSSSPVIPATPIVEPAAVRQSIQGDSGSQESQANVGDFLSEARRAILSGRSKADEGQQASSGGTNSAIDSIQTILDVAGVADPTPIIDGVNMVMSLGRAVVDPSNAGHHLVNAATSAVSMVPFVGDLAKLGKFGSKAGAKAGAHAAKAPHVVPPPIQPMAVNGVTPPPVQGGAGGIGSPPGGGSPPTGAMGSGVPWGTVLSWAAVGTAIAIGFKQSLEQGKALLGLLKPDAYTGDSFDSAKASIDRYDKSVDATIPLAKYMPSEQLRRKAFELIKGVVDWLQSVEQTGKQMVERNRNLAEYSGQIAVAFNRLDVDRIRRDIMKADAMGGDLKGLSASQSAFEAAKQDLFQPFERLQIVVQTRLLDFATLLMRGVDKLEFIGELIDYWLGYAKEQEARSGLESAIQQVEKPPKKRV